MPGRNKKRVNYKRLDSKGRRSPSIEVEVEVDSDLSGVDDPSMGELNPVSPAIVHASSRQGSPSRASPTTSPQDVEEVDIVEMRAVIEAQEQRLRQVLLRKEMDQLRATFRKNEEALQRQAADNMLPVQPVSAPPTANRRAPFSQQNAVQSSSRQRQNTRTQEGEFHVDGFQAESENFIIGLVNNDNKRAISGSSIGSKSNNRNVNIDSDMHNTSFARSNHGSVCAQTQVNARVHTDEIKSGRTARPVDRVQSAQHWAHAALPGDFNSEANISFADLDFRRLIAGEMEIILEFQISQTELEGRLRLLRTLAFLLGSYPWTAVRSVYAAILRRIELGRMTWASDISETMSFALLTYAEKTPAAEARPEKGRSYSRRNAGPSHGAASGESSRVWYCPEYQRSTCAHNEPHQKEMYGKQVTVHHVCAKCLLRDRREAKHPDTSSACPHNRD